MPAADLQYVCKVMNGLSASVHLVSRLCACSVGCCLSY